MKINFHGMLFEPSRVSFYLWSPWRATALEHRLYSAVRKLANIVVQTEGHEEHIDVLDEDVWEQAFLAMNRVLLGWQEDADAAEERRSWRWVLEGNTDNHGFDHTGQPAGVWWFLRLALDQGGPAEPEKGEDIDLHSFGIRFWPVQEK
jgi:hypothetical protein